MRWVITIPEEERAEAGVDSDITVAPSDVMAELILLAIQGMHEDHPGTPLIGDFQGSVMELSDFFVRILNHKWHLLYLGYAYHTMLVSLACPKCAGKDLTYIGSDARGEGAEQHEYRCACNHTFTPDGKPNFTAAREKPAELHRSRGRPPGQAQDPVQRFKAKVVQVGGDGEDACFQWHGSVDRGYAVFKVGGKKAQARRWAYEQFIGPIPEKHDVTASCTNALCVRPGHLKAVPRSVNARAGRMKQLAARVQPTSIVREDMKTPASLPADKPSGAIQDPTSPAPPTTPQRTAAQQCPEGHPLRRSGPCLTCHLRSLAAPSRQEGSNVTS